MYEALTFLDDLDSHTCMLDWNNSYDRRGDEFRYMVIFVTVRPKMGSLDYYKDYKETEKKKKKKKN